ncbi:hypothetical protein [Spiroplasma endosymbiont of Nebria brevicollis]|uniref:hypothetical protein n=1 Tax=Spiroplasma endosymbiont of Nebria brevicollis TaxID=3066284 RepID=UPI00313E6004
MVGIVYNLTANDSPDNASTTVPPFTTSTQTDGTTTPRNYTNPTPTGYGLLLSNQFHEDNNDDENTYYFYPVIIAGAIIMLTGASRIVSAANWLSDSNFKKVEVALKGSNFISWILSGSSNIINQQILSGSLKIVGSLFNFGEIFKKDDLKHDFSIKVSFEIENGASNFSFTRNAQLTKSDNELIIEKLQNQDFKKITIVAKKSGKERFNEIMSYKINEKAKIFLKLEKYSDSNGKKIIVKEGTKIYDNISTENMAVSHSNTSWIIKLKIVIYLKKSLFFFIIAIFLVQ